MHRVKFSTEDQDNDEAPMGKHLSIVCLTFSLSIGTCHQKLCS